MVNVPDRTALRKRPEASPTGKAARSLKAEAAAGAMWVTLEMAMVQLTSFCVLIVMTRFVSPRDFGLISISFLATQSLKYVLLDNVAAAIVRKRQATDEDYTTAFWISLALSALGCLALYAGADWCERLFAADGLAPVLRAMSAVVLVMGLSRTHEMWLIRHFRFRSLALRGGIAALAGGAVGVALAVSGAGAMALVGQQVISSLAAAALMWLVCPWRPGIRVSRTAAREIVAFLRGASGNALAYVVNQHCDTFLVALFFGSTSAGVYNVGKRIRLALLFVVATPINSITLPLLAEVQHQEGRLRNGMRTALTLISTLCAPVFLGVAAVAPDIIALLLAPQWAEAGPILAWLAAGAPLLILLTWNDNLFFVANRPAWASYLSLLYSALAIVVFFVLVVIGGGSPAMAFVLPSLVVLPLSAWLTTRLLPLQGRDWVAAVLPGFAAALVMFIAVKLLAANLQGFGTVLRLVMLVGCGALAYGAMLLLVGRAAAHCVFELLGEVWRYRRDTASGSLSFLSPTNPS
jgi:O-antigen/teichoic acid export membrane protein